MNKYLVEFPDNKVEISGASLEEAQDTADMMADLYPKGLEVWYTVTEIK